MATRRAVLGGLAAAAIIPARGWAGLGAPLWLGAAQGGDGGHALHGIGADGQIGFAVALPGRGHAAAAHPERAEAVAFARRPGVFGVVMDCRSGDVLARLTPPEGRQFNGHGAYAPDGAVLYTSEVVAQGSAGRIGLWDARRGYARLGEWPSHGIGPHEIAVTADGRIVVANGGIETDPQDRTPLNLDRMRPNLAVLGPDGALELRRELPAALRQNSIRHLALMGADVAFAMQWQGDAAMPVPLLGLARGAGALVSCAVPEAEGFAMQGYAGSVASDGALIAVTSPRGGVAMIFDAQGRHRASLRRADLCGAAARPGGGFVLSDGGGAIWAAGPDGLRLMAHHRVAWDNHLVAITAGQGG